MNLTELDKNKLKKYKFILRDLVKKGPIKAKKNILIQKGGLILPFFLPSVLLTLTQDKINFFDDDHIIIRQNSNFSIEKILVSNILPSTKITLIDKFNAINNENQSKIKNKISLNLNLNLTFELERVFTKNKFFRTKLFSNRIEYFN